MKRMAWAGVCNVAINLQEISNQDDLDMGHNHLHTSPNKFIERRSGVNIERVTLRT